MWRRGEPAWIAATVHLPEPARLRARPIICFAKPGGGYSRRYYTIDLPTQEAYAEVVARVDAAGIPSNQTEAGLLLHDPSQNGVILRITS